MTTQAIEETLRQCIKEGILAPFLKEHKGEVHEMMDHPLNEERIREIHIL